jgi:hypothetical protein
VLWGLTGADWYCLLVFQRRWEPARYEEWLAQALIDLLLEPQKLPTARLAARPDRLPGRPDAGARPDNTPQA